MGPYRSPGSMPPPEPEDKWAFLTSAWFVTVYSTGLGVLIGVLGIVAVFYLVTRFELRHVPDWPAFSVCCALFFAYAGYRIGRVMR